MLKALDAALGPIAQFVAEIHAGKEYRAFGLEAGLRARGARVEVPTRGLGIGRQLAFYKRGQAVPGQRADPQMNRLAHRDSAGEAAIVDQSDDEEET